MALDAARECAMISASGPVRAGVKASLSADSRPMAAASGASQNKAPQDYSGVDQR